MNQSKKKERKAWTREKKIKTLLIGISIVHQTYGPYYPWNFQIECHALGIEEIGKWIPTKPRPEFADPIFWEKQNEQ